MTNTISFGAEFMRNLVSTNIPNFSSLSDKQKERINLEYHHKGIGNLVIHYPGTKKRGDYVAKLRGRAISHSEVVEALGETVQNEKQALELCDFIISIYNIGLNAVPPNWLELEFFNHRYAGNQIVPIIYWIVVQEEINYPERGRCLGPRLAFSRYLEGLFAAIYDDPANSITLQEIKKRAKPGEPSRQIFDDLNIVVGLNSQLYRQIRIFYKNI